MRNLFQPNFSTLNISSFSHILITLHAFVFRTPKGLKTLRLFSEQKATSRVLFSSDSTLDTDVN